MKTKKKVTFDEAREARNARKKQENVVKVGPPSKQSEVVQRSYRTVERIQSRSQPKELERKS
jgi:hypothetical protein